jgi:hypothetical protein
MATWVRSLDADEVGIIDATLVGPSSLSNDTVPGDFDPTKVTSVRFQFTLSHQGTFASGSGSDSYALQNMEIDTPSAGPQLANITASGTMQDGTDTIVIDTTDNTPNTSASSTNWQNARLNGDNASNNIAVFTQNKGKDGTTPQILASSVTITITYDTVSIVDLSGAGYAASEGTADLNPLVLITGTGVAASETFTPLSVTRRLPGHGDAASDTSSPLSVTRRLPGHGDAASEGTAAFRVLVPMSGSGNSASEGTAVMRLIKSMSGHGDAASEGPSILTTRTILSGHGDAASEGTSAASMLYALMLRPKARRVSRFSRPSRATETQPLKVLQRCGSSFPWLVQGMRHRRAPLRWRERWPSPGTVMPPQKAPPTSIQLWRSLVMAMLRVTVLAPSR